MSSRALILQRLAAHSRGEFAATQLSGNTADEFSGQISAATVKQSFAEDYARFTELAALTQMSAAEVTSYDKVPAAVQDYLQGAGLALNVVLDASLPVTASCWSLAGLSAQSGNVRPDNDVYVGCGLAAIAECGAMLIASGQQRALRNDFLARTHIVVVPTARLLPAMQDFWSIVRGDIGADRLAREYCMVTGPSRTADLGVPAKLGAHGPARVHVIFAGDA